MTTILWVISGTKSNSEEGAERMKTILELYIYKLKSEKKNFKCILE